MNLPPSVCHASRPAGRAGGAATPAREGKTTSTLGLDSISEGTEIRLIRFDRSAQDGIYRGLQVISGKLYARTYDTLVARSPYRGYVPQLNERVTFGHAEITEAGFFKGVDRGELLFQPSSGEDTLGIVPEDIDWIRSSDSLRMEGRTVRKLVHNGSMPGRRVIELEIDHAMMHVPYESIEIVQIVPRGSGALAGFLIGAAVDLTAIILVVSAERQTEADCNSSWGRWRR